MSGRERTRRGFLGASIATGIGAAMRSSLPSRPPWRAASTTARPDDRARPVHAARAPGSVIKACTVYDKPWWRDKGLSGSSVSIDRLVSATFDNSAEDALADRDRDQARVANTRALHDAASPRRCRQLRPGRDPPPVAHREHDTDGDSAAGQVPLPENRPGLDEDAASQSKPSTVTSPIGWSTSSPPTSRPPSPSAPPRWAPPAPCGVPTTACARRCT